MNRRETTVPLATHDAFDPPTGNRRARPRHTLVVAIIAAAAMLGGFATIALWASRQALDTRAWTETSSELLADGDIQAALSTYLVDALFTSVDVKAELQASLPADARGLAVPATAGLRALGERAALAALQRPLVQRLWEESNRAAHRTLVAALRGDPEVLATTGGSVTLNLVPLVEQVGTQLGLDVAGKIPANVGSVELLRSQRLASAQVVARNLRIWGTVLPIAALGLLAIAVYLARGWRREALEDVGIALVAVGFFVLVARGVVGAYVVKSLATTPAVEPAARSVWEVGTSLLAASAIGLVGYGAVVLLGAWLAGPTATASRIRHRIAPMLRKRRLAYAALAVVLALVFWWNPTPGTERLVPALILIVLAVAALEALRAVSMREVDAGPTELPTDTTPRVTRRKAG